MTSSVTETRQHQKPARRNLSVGFARSEREILEAQKLRYHIFAGELGARLPTREPGVDQDIFDPYCEHLVVRDEGSLNGVYVRVRGTVDIAPNDTTVCASSRKRWSSNAERTVPMSVMSV